MHCVIYEFRPLLANIICVLQCAPSSRAASRANARGTAHTMPDMLPLSLSL